MGLPGDSILAGPKLGPQVSDGWGRFRPLDFVDSIDFFLNVGGTSQASSIPRYTPSLKFKVLSTAGYNSRCRLLIPGTIRLVHALWQSREGKLAFPRTRVGDKIAAPTKT